MTAPVPHPVTLPSFGEKVARLRERYLQQLPERIAQVQALVQQLCALPHPPPAADPQALELHRLLHNLKGTSHSFGLSALGDCAALGEELLQPCLSSEGPQLPPDWQSQLRTCLQQLQQWQQLHQLAHAMGQYPGAASVAPVPPGATAAPDAASCAGQGPAALPTLVSGPVPAPAPAEPALVYVCDDEVFMLEQLTAQLACFGYATRSFTDPQALRAAVLQRRPAAVVMDIHFPQGHKAGIDVLLALKEETGSAVPAIFVSAHSDFDVRLGAVRAHGSAYLVKPVRANDLVSALDHITRPATHEPYRVLIVDDEPAVSHYHALLLQEAGMVTQEIDNPRAILQTLSVFQPDIVLMDMYMPECTGREVAQIIRQEAHHIALPIVYLTSETDRRKLFSAMRIGVEGFLSKPVVPDELIAAVAIRAERMRTLRTLMARDSLTGLFNHTTTTQLLDNALALAQRNRSELSFVMLDLDHFKAINDSYGHPAGDRVLLGLSRLLQQRLRSTDIVGRYGGEEFAIALHSTSKMQAQHLLNSLREDFSRLVFYSGEQEFRCSFSAGIATYPQYQRLETLRQAADDALYRAKHQGRNCVVVV